MVNNEKESTTSVPGESVSANRRTLLKASWVAPVVMAISLPKSSFAQNVSGGQVQEICQQAGLNCTPEQQNIILQILQKLFGK